MFQIKLKELRETHHISQAKLAKALGVSQSTVAMWEVGKSRPEYDTLMKLAEYFSISVDELTSGTKKITKSPSNILPLPRMVKKPLVGTIACGQPILAIQNIEQYLDVPENIHCDFILRCKGDSMIDARIYDGDLVYIRQQEMVETGEIAAVLIDDSCESEATLKRVYISEDHIILRPENRAYEPFVYFRNDMNKVHIIGKAVAFTSCVR